MVTCDLIIVFLNRIARLTCIKKVYKKASCTGVLYEKVSRADLSIYWLPYLDLLVGVLKLKIGVMYLILASFVCKPCSKQTTCSVKPTTNGTTHLTLHVKCPFSLICVLASILTIAIHLSSWLGAMLIVVAGT